MRVLIGIVVFLLGLWTLPSCLKLAAEVEVLWWIIAVNTRNVPFWPSKKNMNTLLLQAKESQKESSYNMSELWLVMGII